MSPDVTAVVLGLMRASPNVRSVMRIKSFFGEAKSPAAIIHPKKARLAHPLLFLQRRRLVEEWGYIKPGHYTNYIQPHLQSVAASLKNLEDKLPAHKNSLDSEDADVIRSQQHDAVIKVSTLPRQSLRRKGGLGRIWGTERHKPNWGRR